MIRGFPTIVLAYGGIQSFDWRRAPRRPNLGVMRIQKGKKVPNVVLAIREEGRFTRLETDEIFLGKKVVVFSLPGAFTPTCSSTHLPRYEELAPIFKQAGVDDIVCVSVNDAFVMEAWGKAQGLSQIRLLPDGNGYFSEAVGMLVDKSQIGFGKRSWRYSMFVDDGVVKELFVEPEQDGDPFEVSDADTMLRAIAGLQSLESGSIKVRGEAQLLGVGAALKPTLSGYRNVMLGGLAIGLTRAEVEARMQGVVEFSGLADAMGRPMSTYSSGMRARLAFSIATLRVPDILLIDEALAVGDKEFRERSLARINDIREQAGTVVMVTHNLGEIRATCNRVIWLSDGALRADGAVDDVLEAYEADE